MTLKTVDLENRLVEIRRSKQVDAVHACNRCDRSEARLPIPGRGPVPSKGMILLDTPAAARQVSYLSTQLVRTHLPPVSHWYIATVVKCGAGPIEALPAALCLDHLRSEVALVNPDWVLVMGVPALTATGIRDTLARIHGRPFVCPAGPFKGRKLFPTYHPEVEFKDAHAANLLTSDLSTLYGLLSGRIAGDTAMARVGRGGKLNLNVEA